MTQPIYYNDSYYVPRSEQDQLVGFLLASLASGAIMKGLSLAGDSFHRELVKQQKDNSTYRTYLNKALKLSGLEEKGVDIIPA